MKSIPDSHLDLLTDPNVGVLTTIMPDGTPQNSLVWLDWDGTYVTVNTTKEKRKGKNMLQNPKVGIIVVDPKNSNRWISIQGDVEIETTDVIKHLNDLTAKYTKHKQFYGQVYPLEQQYKETRIICKIKPKKVLILKPFN